MVYKTKGVCAREIEFEVDDNNKVHNVHFIGGCDGNTKGVASLVEGMDAKDVIWKVSNADSRAPHVRISFLWL